MTSQENILQQMLHALVMSPILNILLPWNQGKEMALYFQYNQGLGTNESLLKTSPLTKNPDTQVRDPGYL